MILLEASWVLKIRVLSTLSKVITIVILLITILISTHGLPSRVWSVKAFGIVWLNPTLKKSPDKRHSEG